MKRVQHDEIKPTMTIKLSNHGGSGRWATVHRIVEVRPGSAVEEACAKVIASYLNGAKKGEPFQLTIYAQESGYELHPESAILAAKGVMRKGRAEFVKNIVIREYTIKFAIVDRVDNQDVVCGYCLQRPITSNIYATVATDGGRTKESAWSTCGPCEIHSIDGVEDVDPSHTITIERAQR